MIQYHIYQNIKQQLFNQIKTNINQESSRQNFYILKKIHEQILQIKKYLQIKLLKFNRLFYIKYTIQDLNNSNHVQTMLSLNINTLIPKDKINNYKNKIQLLNNLSPISIKIDNNDILYEYGKQTNMHGETIKQCIKHIYKHINDTLNKLTND